MKRAIAETADRINDYRANITTALLGAAILAAILYAFNLYALISRTVAIGQTEKQSAAISSVISALDGQYLKLTSAITPDTLAEHGLTSGQVSIYITRPSRTASIGDLASVGHEL